MTLWMMLISTYFGFYRSLKDRFLILHSRKYAGMCTLSDKEVLNIFCAVACLMLTVASPAHAAHQADNQEDSQQLGMLSDDLLRSTLQGFWRLGAYEQAKTAETIQLERLRAQGRDAEAADAELRLATLDQILNLSNEDQRRLAAVDALTPRIGLAYRDAELQYAVSLTQDQIATRAELLGEDHPNTAGARSNLGLFLHELGDLEAAEFNHRRAYRTLSQHLPADSPRLSGIVHNLAFALRDLGRLYEAEHYYRLAIESRRAHADRSPAAVVDSLNGLAVTLWRLDRQDEAAEMLQDALTVLDKHDIPKLSLRLQNNLAWLALQHSNIDVSELHLREAKAVIDRHKFDPLDLAWVDLTEAEVLLARGDYLRSDTLLRRTEETFGEHYSTDRVLLADILRRRARLSIMLGRDDEAVVQYERALEIAELSRTRIIGGVQERALFAGQAGLPQICDEFARLLCRLGEADRAVTILERGRSRAALDMIAAGSDLRSGAVSHLSEDALSEYDRAIEAERAARQTLIELELKLLSGNESGREELLVLVQSARREVESATAVVFATLRGVVPQTQPFTAHELMNELSADAGILTYLWTEEVVYTILVSAHGVSVAEVSSGREAVQELTQGVHRLANDLRSSHSSTDSLRDGLATAGSIVPGEFRDQLERMSSVTIVPDGPLGRIPFELLMPDLGVIYAPSGSFAVRSRTEHHKHMDIGDYALLVGDPVYTDSPEYEAIAARIRESRTDLAPGEAETLEQLELHGTWLSPLPGTRLEISYIQELFDGRSETLLGDAASVTNIRRALSGRTPSILHVAAHGLPGSSRRPLHAALALSTPDTPSPEDNGFLTLEQLLTGAFGTLQGTQLVVLSACATAQGIEQGDTDMMLPMGFLALGANTVVATLWPVDDYATSLLMYRFYQNLVGSDQHSDDPGDRSVPRPSEALREAQTWLRQLTHEEVSQLRSLQPNNAAIALARGDIVPARGRIVKRETVEPRPFEHPYYWAGFVVFGEQAP